MLRNYFVIFFQYRIKRKEIMLHELCDGPIGSSIVGDSSSYSYHRSDRRTLLSKFM